MAREFPVGTIRSWESGDVIKAHSPLPPFHNGWIPLSRDARLEAVGITCDRIAREILSYKEPIEGELFLDHEINEFEDESGGKPFKSDEFKQYEGFYGAGRYAFRNEFSKRFMNEKMSLSEAIAIRLIEENEAKGGDKDNIVLTQDERDRIRKKVKAEFKYMGELFDLEKAEQLQKILERTLEQLKVGTDFKDSKQKTTYEDQIKFANSLPESYYNIRQKRKEKIESINIIEDVFKDNWGIRESFKKYIEKKFDEFVKRYTDQIIKDSAEDQLNFFNTKIDASTEDFYSKIANKVKDFSKEEKVEWSDAFKDLVYIRFLKKYNKRVEGNWNLNHINIMYNFEKSVDSLPDGHFDSNSKLDIITNQNYNAGSHGGYAWYSPMEYRINFSNDSISEGEWGQLNDTNDFNSTLLHEIGHAVSKKLGSTDYYDYKKFVVEAGWSYEQKELRQGMTATGSQKDIDRGGSNSSVPLITIYAHKSPEEAFAEYYSFYSINKKAIDAYLMDSNPIHLNKKTSYITEDKPTEKPLHRYFHREVDEKIYENFHNIHEDISFKGKGIDYDFISPWNTKRSRDEKAQYSSSKLRYLKDNKEYMNIPIVAYREGGDYVVINGSHRVEANRINKRMVPALHISREFYYNLKKEGFSDVDISHCVQKEKGNEMIKIQTSIPKKVSGLVYRDRLIDFEQLRKNANVFRAMKHIWESRELEKALDEMSIKVNNIEKSEGNIFGNILNRIQKWL